MRSIRPGFTSIRLRSTALILIVASGWLTQRAALASEGRRPNTVDHRQPEAAQPRRNEAAPARRGRLPAPSQLVLSEIGRTSMRLNWMDNATDEFGVAVERGSPIPERGGTHYRFEHAFDVHERVMDRVRSTGWRTDLDDRLEPGTEYCYRVRAYRSRPEQYSAYAPVACARTDP